MRSKLERKIESIVVWASQYLSTFMTQYKRDDLGSFSLGPWSGEISDHCFNMPENFKAVLLLEP